MGAGCWKISLKAPALQPGLKLLKLYHEEPRGENDPVKKNQSIQKAGRKPRHCGTQRARGGEFQGGSMKICLFASYYVQNSDSTILFLLQGSLKSITDLELNFCMTQAMS
ncbi:uncharacterized protein LOC144316452 isoform X3 [Canis aureus]